MRIASLLLIPSKVKDQQDNQVGGRVREGEGGSGEEVSQTTSPGHYLSGGQKNDNCLSCSPILQATTGIQAMAASQAAEQLEITQPL